MTSIQRRKPGGRKAKAKAESGLRSGSVGNGDTSLYGSFGFAREW